MPRQHATVVLLPTFNEKENLPAIVPAILAAAPVDILILDDNSPDGTGTLADALAAQNPRVQVVHRKERRGLGAAYLDGFARALEAGYEFIVEMDADFSHPPKDLPRLIDLAKQYDLVLGSRWVEGGGTKGWPLHRQLISRGGSLYTQLVLGERVRDFTGGFKCFRRKVLLALDLGDVRATGYAFQIEMTYRALKKGFVVHEMPFTFVERAKGASKMSGAIVREALFGVPRLRSLVRS